MANHIAAFFRAQGEASAPAMVADHLTKFWEPRIQPLAPGTGVVAARACRA